MDMEMTNNAVSVSGFTKELTDWIWVKKREAFEVY